VHGTVLKNSFVPAGPITRTITGPILGRAATSNAKKGATFALCYHQFRYKPNPIAITRKAKGITLLKLLSLNVADLNCARSVASRSRHPTVVREQAIGVLSK
jgi:hypothetical protein